MGTIWLKERYAPEDRHPVTRELVPGAIPPGLYCEDLEGFRHLQRGARVRGRPFEPALSGPARYDGKAVYVATPEQAAFFRANAVQAPSPSKDGTTRMRQVAAEMQAAIAKAARNDEPPPPRVSKPFRGMNRAARRRAGA
ncbi:hypothetical protein FV226_13180 [Methylobacterium sp. WL12]|uniref:hypothetical protein n=1 Tax=Methylobacterium sp. WL12 TaxID=2603890 RepID=UPI0011CAE546|nr:hypothetical protein [Methylobacterium sp. WL12]TXM72176.1 hypothetical protein FV226_13180 [Methylobacterium sp. WL12]